MWLSRSIRRSLKRREMLRFHRAFIRPGDLCFDIGANIGERTDAMLALGARVVAVEPRSTCMQVLRERFSGHDRVELVHAALGARPGEADLMICAETDECCTLSDDFVRTFSTDSLHWHAKERVQVLTLDVLHERYGAPRFCKIDVEGFESQVLRGNSLPFDTLCFEFNRPLLADTLECLRILHDQGDHECNYIAFERMKLVLEEWIPLPRSAEELERMIPEDIATGEIIVRRRT